MHNWKNIYSYTYKNKGMLIENIIDKTIEKYKRNKIALIDKIFLPIKIKKAEYVNNKKVITKGWILNKSTVDYFGIYKKYFIAFEVKSSNDDFFDFNKIKKHQKEYIDNVCKYGGLGFFIIYFKKYHACFLIQNKNLDSLTKKISKIEEIKDFSIEINFLFPNFLNLANALDKII